MIERTEIFLDCTLRDGGYYNRWDFPLTLICDYLLAMQAAQVDVVELGFRSLKNTGFSGPCAFTTDEFLRSLPLADSLLIGVMVNASELVGDTAQQKALDRLFPTGANESPVDLVRIACHVHEVSAALPAVEWLKVRGYMVGFNLMQVADRSEDDIRGLANKAADYPIDALYFADSMGSMNPEQVAQVVSWIQSERDGAIGIHTHDNLGLGLSNTLCALDQGVTWVDSTVTGMGRGPGNARTEELAIEMAERRGVSVNLVPLMTLLRKHFKPLQAQYGWGTNPYYYLAGKHGIHPTYIQAMLNDSRYDEEDVLAVIEHLRKEGGKKFSPNTLDAARHFYTGAPDGQWNPADMLDGRDVLLLGSGPGVEQHRHALEAYIRKARPVVVALNTQAGIDADLIDVRVACHPVRLLADCESHTRLPQPLITPFTMLPHDVQKALEGKDVLDFGLTVEADTFAFHQTHCTTPTSLVVAYALAVATCGRASRVLMAGFDGYAGDDPRSVEMQKLLACYQQADATPIVSVTATRYTLPTQSIYAL